MAGELDSSQAVFQLLQLGRKITAFQREQRKLLRRGGSVFRKGLSDAYRNGPLTSSRRGKKRGIAGRKPLGPLAQSVRVLAFYDRTNAAAVKVRLSKKGFYGRFHEFGLSTTVKKGGSRPAYITGRGGIGPGIFRQLKQGRRLVIPARPIWSKVYEDKRSEVETLIGDSYDVLLSGGDGAR